ncbi:DUF2254 domain-containing protein [Thalassotalea mangrovi]|uniref:DUF2254 domain-containing protein n=1 Tax=Thalassotalea mangrovi TaxID=2572245 RepID=A0A4U1B6Z9_9GAMM|nr:DUF2254 domain-containing protein [Thalassotalea mangrovi]TKB45705.1 DUF2254 domain-containing protein [Thalassotalea mangrovi]
MDSKVSKDHLSFLIKRLRERLWVKPLMVCVLSISAVFTAKLAENTWIAQYTPNVSRGSLETLLSIMATSMLVIATFSVSSLLSAYASASSNATPRSFALVIADDKSKNALSTFVGAFIFSIVALIAFKNDFFQAGGIFVLFVFTLIVFALVILTFVRWVDCIARLGRMGSTIGKVEHATRKALLRRRNAPTLGGKPLSQDKAGQRIYASKVGFVQHIDMEALQGWAKDKDKQVRVEALPGSLAAPGRPIASLLDASEECSTDELEPVRNCFAIGDERMFDYDPRFGLVVLSEISSRALSPAVNDPGTAITIIGVLVRLITLWSRPLEDEETDNLKFDRVEVGQVSVMDMFDDAFSAIARDGARNVEVLVRLQKGLGSIAAIGDKELREAAQYQARIALKRGKHALEIDEDKQQVETAAEFVFKQEGED